MIRWFTTHPTAANVLMIILMILGLQILPQLKRATFPDIDSNEVQVRVVYPGASAYEVEESICLRLEDATTGISYVEERECESREGLAIMRLKMLEQGDLQRFLDDVRTEVDAIDDFADSVELPVITEQGRTDQVVDLAISADLPQPELKAYAEDLKQRLLRLPAVSLVDVQGFSDHQLRIELDDIQLRQYGLSVSQVADIVRRQGVDMPAGTLETAERDMLIRVTDKRRTPAELAELIVLRGERGSELRLGDIATITDTFELKEAKIVFNGLPAGLLNIKKNKEDDALQVLREVEDFIEQEQRRLPPGMSLQLTQDVVSIIIDRLTMLLNNGWQGLLLVFLTLSLFFSVRYSFWVVMGLPVSFLGAFWIMGLAGQTINMLSMVGLLLGIGLLMDDAIVISESIAQQLKRGKSPMEAATTGLKMVARGVFSSFITTMLILQGILFMRGDMGQFLNDIPIVLIIVMAISLIEAFLILPHHLAHSMEAHKDSTPAPWRQQFEQRFEHLRQWVGDYTAAAVRWRYPFLGGVVALFLVSLSLMAGGVLKFVGLPELDGDVLSARVILPQGTPLHRTEGVIDTIVVALKKVGDQFDENESEALIKNINIRYGENPDAYENGPHIANVTVDLLTAEKRNTTLDQLTSAWREETGALPGVIALQFKEPMLGPMGRPLHLRLSGDNLEHLSQASTQLQNWLRGYDGVVDIMDDLRPGKPELQITLKEGAYSLGIDATAIAQQLRAAYYGAEAQEIQVGQEAYDIQVQLAPGSKNSLADFDYFPIVHPQSGVLIPLSSIANVTMGRGFARINRFNNRRTVSVYADIIRDRANLEEVVADVKVRMLPGLLEAFPGISFSVDGELKNVATTQGSMTGGMLLGVFGVFLLLSLQFKNYLEPVVVLVAIPLCLIGVFWGHLLMGYDIAMPSLVGFFSLAGIVVNDSILLVEFVKYRVQEGMSVHDAAIQASRDRFRAVFLTSATTIAGVAPLLLETSLQAQILKPLVISIVFGMMTATGLVLFVVPACYAVLEDFGLLNIERKRPQVTD